METVSCPWVRACYPTCLASLFYQGFSGPSSPQPHRSRGKSCQSFLFFPEASAFHLLSPSAGYLVGKKGTAPRPHGFRLPSVTTPHPTPESQASQEWGLRTSRWDGESGCRHRGLCCVQAAPSPHPSRCSLPPFRRPVTLSGAEAILSVCGWGLMYTTHIHVVPCHLPLFLCHLWAPPLHTEPYLSLWGLGKDRDPPDIGLAKKFVWVSCKMLRKNPNELFGQANSLQFPWYRSFCIKHSSTHTLCQVLGRGERRTRCDLVSSSEALQVRSGRQPGQGTGLIRCSFLQEGHAEWKVGWDSRGSMTMGAEGRKGRT